MTKIFAETIGLGEVLELLSSVTWEFQNKDTQSVYIYYGFSNTTNWKIKRKTIATNIWKTATGIGDYATAWIDRENKIYS